MFWVLDYRDMVVAEPVQWVGWTNRDVPSFKFDVPSFKFG